MAYQQRCIVCRKNLVLVKSRRQKPVCTSCWKRQNQANWDADIADAKMRKFFDIPAELYRKSAFLRDIRRHYVVNEMLSEKQMKTFKKVVKEMQEENDEE